MFRASSKAIEQINAGNMPLANLVDKFDLTSEQLMRVGREVKQNEQ